MSTIVTRAGKGSALTHDEVDANFVNLNTDKYQSGGALGTPASGNLANCTFPTLNQDTTGNAATATYATSAGNSSTVTNGVYTSDIGSTVLAYDSNLQSFVNTFTLPMTDSTSGYVLATNGSGVLSFVAQSGGGGSGTVTSVSVVSANGFSGTVANATTTPAITLTTSITGLLKGNGTAISAASSGTDYAPATSGTSILYGNGSGGFSNVTVGSGLSFSTGTLSATGGSMVYPSAGIAVSTGSAWTTSLTAPSGTIVGTSDSQTLTNKTISGSNNTLSNIANASLTNSSVTVNGSSISLGGSATVTANTTNALTIGTGLSGTSFNGSSAVTVAIDSTVATLSGTQTLTNKRITSRVSTTTSSATPTINTDNVDFYGLTAQAVDITSFTTNLSGTPTDGQKLWIYIVGTAARAITWGASFESSTATLPTTTVSTNRLDVGFVWNTATSKWRCVAVA